jgi:hypothetical protein
MSSALTSPPWVSVCFWTTPENSTWRRRGMTTPCSVSIR